VDVNELKELIEIVENSGLSELEIEEDGRRIRLQKPTAVTGGSAPISMVVPTPEPVATPTPTTPTVEVVPEPEEEIYAEVINSPMVGTFYGAPAPGEDQFVQVGDQVEDGQTVCIVEAMKLMNEVSAKSNCIIEKILLENGQPVEFGQPLFAIRHL
jgi:acetyl-CoA carboxylase biotin carboxyl carrier protein